MSQSTRPTRTLYNKKDVFGVKHDTQNEQSRAEIVRQNIARKVLVSDAA